MIMYLAIFKYRIMLLSRSLNTLYYQVLEFVGLTELYYAGSHGMDIMGPVIPSTAGHINWVRSTEKQVVIIIRYIFFETYRYRLMFYLLLIKLVLFLMIIG